MDVSWRQSSCSLRIMLEAGAFPPLPPRGGDGVFPPLPPRGGDGGRDNSWLTCLQRNPRARLRVFCLPYAGGGTQAFRDWGRELPPGVEICAIRLPGRESRLREPPILGLKPLVDAIAPALERHLDLPFVFFGHSMGALLSFELARQFRRKGYRSPEHLIVSGRRAPHVPDSDPPKHDLPEAEFIEELKELNGTPREIMNSKELMDLMIPTLRADFAVCETYSYSSEPRLACSISAYSGLEDPEVEQEEADAWREQTDGSFVLRMFPGDHFYFQQQRQLFFQMLRQDLYGIVGK